MDVMMLVVPDTHIWPVFMAWVGCYVMGHFIGSGLA